jgi:asparagine synthase (glutamine-hydrolysing)
MNVRLNTIIEPSLLQKEGFKHIGNAYYVKIDGFPLFNLSGNCCHDEYDTVIEAYRFGIENIYSKLDGSFSVIMYDDFKKEIVIITDPYGLQNVYYYFSTDRGFTFSGDLENLLLQCPWKEIDINRLAEYLRFLDISAPHTIYKNVYRLEPGSVLTYSVSDNELVIKHVSKRNNYSSYLSRNYLDEFENILSESIERRISESNKIGLMLSGGIDSSLLAVMLTRLKKNKSLRLSAYTAGFDDAELDESTIARKIADYLGITHHVLKFTADEDLMIFYEFIKNLSIPFADPAVLPTMLIIKRMVGDGINVVIEGTGADGIIGYMPSEYHRMVFNYTSKIPYHVRKLMTYSLNIIKDPLDIKPLFEFKDAQEKFIRWKGWTENEIGQLCGIKCSFEDTTFYKTFNRYKKRGIYELYRQLMISMPDDRLIEPLRYYKVKPVLPFFDKCLREYITSLPFHLKYKDGAGKVLYRELLGRYIPKDLWDVPKHGFDYPFENLLRHDNSKLLRTHLSKDAISECGFFDFSVVDNYLQKFLHGDNTVKFKIWALVIFMAWYHENRMNC